MRLQVHLRLAERVGPAPQRRQVRGARHSRRIRCRYPVVQRRTGHSRHARGRSPEEPYGQLAGPGEPERVRFRDFDLRAAPGARQLDHDDQAFIPVGAEDQLPGLAHNRLLRELGHSDPPPAQRRLRHRNEKRTEQVRAAGYSFANRAHGGQSRAAGPRQVFCFRQPSRIRARDGFRQRRDDLLREIALVRTCGVHGDRQDCRSHPMDRFDALSHRNRGHLGPAHQRLAQQRFHLRTTQNGVTTVIRRHEGGSYPNPGRLEPDRHDPLPARARSRRCRMRRH